MKIHILQGIINFKNCPKLTINKEENLHNNKYRKTK